MKLFLAYIFVAAVMALALVGNSHADYRYSNQFDSYSNDHLRLQRESVEIQRKALALQAEQMEQQQLEFKRMRRDERNRQFWNVAPGLPVPGLGDDQ